MTLELEYIHLSLYKAIYVDCHYDCCDTGEVWILWIMIVMMMLL